MPLDEVHTFLGQMFIFGFKTKTPVRTSTHGNSSVSLQTVTDCTLLSKFGSDSDVTEGHLKGKDQSLVAWQMTQANTDQQI